MPDEEKDGNLREDVRRVCQRDTVNGGISADNSLE